MGPRLNTLAARLRAGTLALGIATAALAPLLVTAASARVQPTIAVADASLVYGDVAVVRGGVGIEGGGRGVALEFRGPGGAWRVIDTAVARRDGRFAFRVRPRRSGALRVALVEASGPRSPARRVSVAARLPVPYRRLDVLPGRPAVVKGAVRPGAAGRLVRLEVRRGRRWRAVAHDRTDRRGPYALAHRPRGAGSRFARVAFAGDAANGRAVRRIGRLHAYRPSLASRYDLYGGALACGGSLGYRSLVVAHRWLPCGTRVRIRYRGRAVTAVVRDRGPFVGGREYDLAGAVARRLGFDGVGRIWVTR